MVLMHDADIVIHRECCHVRWPTLCGSSEGTRDLNSWIVRRGRVSLNSDIGGPAMAVLVIRNGFSAVKTIGGESERIDDAGIQQIRVTESQSLRQSFISGPSGSARDSVARAQQIVIQVVRRRAVVLFHQISAEDRVLVALLQVDSSNRHRIVGAACTAVNHPAARIGRARQQL